MQTIKFGSRGEDVKALQKALNLYPDGIFGSITQEAVMHYQKANGLTIDGIVGPKTWAKLLSETTLPMATVPNGFTLKKTKRNIKRIIVHCTATHEGQDFTVNDIRKWHVKDRGWSDIGYHYVVYRDGTIHEGRNVDIIGAHTTNYNSTSIGVVYVGGLEAKTMKGKDTRTDAQKAGLLALIKELKKLYPSATVHGHSEFANKACPCFNAKSEYAKV